MNPHLVSNIHIYAPKTIEIRAIFLHCPFCKKKRKMLFQLWEYFSRMTCLSCGDVWSEGHLIERPFMPGWRQKNIVKAKQLLEQEMKRRTKVKKKKKK